MYLFTLTTDLHPRYGYKFYKKLTLLINVLLLMYNAFSLDARCKRNVHWPQRHNDTYLNHGASKIMVHV